VTIVRPPVVPPSAVADDRLATVNRVLAKHLVERQQMQWTKKDAHLLVQARTQVLHEDWKDYFRQQYPGFQPLPVAPLLIAA
jgi:hypothetical protein